MIKSKLILCVSFLIALAAGTALGMLIARSSSDAKAAPKPAEGTSQSRLADELKLSDQQREDMKQIWSQTTGAVFRSQGERRSSLAKQREEGIAALLSDDQKAKYEGIAQDYSRKAEQFAQENRKDREAQIAAMLSSEQKTKYEAIQQEYSRQTELLAQERKKAFDEAVDRTRKILTADQAARYEEILKNPDRGGVGIRPPRHRRPATSSRPTTETQPASHGGE